MKKRKKIDNFFFFLYNGRGDTMVKIGIPLKYSHLEDGRNILYLGEKVRRTIQKAGGFIIPICSSTRCRLL